LSERLAVSRTLHSTPPHGAKKAILASWGGKILKVGKTAKFRMEEHIFIQQGILFEACEINF